MAFFLTMSTDGTHDAANNRTFVAYAVALNWNGGSSSNASATASGFIEYNIGNGNVSIPITVASPTVVNSGGSSSGFVMLTAFDTGFYISHNANGEMSYIRGGATYSSSFVGSVSATDFVGSIPDYDRSPSDPSFASTTRSGRNIAVTVNAVSSPASTAQYTITRSQNGGSYGDARSSSSRSTTYSSLPLGSTQQFRVVASNSDGSSATTTSGTVAIPNVPTAPTITTTAPSGRALNVSCGVSANNGATVTGYFVQLSANNGSTWQTAISIPSRAYRFEDLAGGTNVKFRVYSQNEMGLSAFTVTDSIFIPSGGRRLTISGFIPSAIFKRITASGTTDVGTAKRLTSGGWVELG
jgi:hypothetical protein